MLALALLLSSTLSAASQPDLGARFAELSRMIKAAPPKDAAGPKQPPVLKAVLTYDEVALAYKGLTGRLSAAELTIHGGVWSLELAATAAGVREWPGGLAPKGGKPAQLSFTQSILDSSSPYVDRGLVFKAREQALPVAEHRWLEADPPPATIDPSEPHLFTTVRTGRWGAKATKSFDCRAKDDNRLLCKVETTVEGFLIEKGTAYLGFARKR